TVNKATPVVTWTNPYDIDFGTALEATQLNAIANVPGMLTYTPAAGTVLNVGANQILSVNFAPADAINYDPVDNVQVQINVNKSGQVITFASLSTKTLGDADFTLSATASSGLPVAFGSTSDKVTLSGSQATIDKAGRVTITANQTGNDSYRAAAPVDQNFCISPPKPTI